MVVIFSLPCRSFIPVYCCNVLCSVSDACDTETEQVASQVTACSSNTNAKYNTI